MTMDSHSKWLHLQRFLSEVSLDQESRLSLSNYSDSDDEVFTDQNASFAGNTVVPSKSDSDIILCLHSFSKTFACTRHLKCLS